MFRNDIIKDLEGGYMKGEGTLKSQKSKEHGKLASTAMLIQREIKVLADRLIIIVAKNRSICLYGLKPVFDGTMQY